MEFTPWILSFFSNPPPGKEGHLFYVDEERDSLQEVFNATNVQYKPFTDRLDTGKVSEAIRLHWKKYTAIHYSGHADSFRLALPAEQLRADNFIEFVSVCDALQLVFLNGCATQGFVKRLLEASSVQAVIASPRPVDDDTAMRFSVEFYKNLLRDIPIEKSFTAALSAALGQRYTPNANVFRLDMKDGTIRGAELLSEKRPGSNERAVKKAGTNLLDNNQGTSWGLYVKDVQALEWKLFATGNEDMARSEDVKKKIRTVQETILALQMEEEKLVTQIEALKPEVRIPIIQTLLAEKETALFELREERDKKLQEKESLKNNIINLAAEQNDEQVISKYETALRKLNFSDQKKFIDAVRGASALAKVTGFILHGTSECCLNQLSRNLVLWLGIDKIDNKAIFDYDSVHQEDEFWEKLRIDFQLNTPSDDPARIVQEIQSRYRDEDGNTQADFAVLFRNSSTDFFADAAMREKIAGFWEKFTGYFLLADQAYSSYEHRIYLFLIDDQCQLIVAPPTFVSSREKEYKLFVPDQQPAGVSMQLLPTVVPVAATEISPWQTENSIPEKYWYSPRDLQDIFTQTSGLLLPTIRELSSRKIKTTARKFRAYQSFLSSIQNPL